MSLISLNSLIISFILFFIVLLFDFYFNIALILKIKNLNKKDFEKKYVNNNSIILINIFLIIKILISLSTIILFVFSILKIEQSRYLSLIFTLFYLLYIILVLAYNLISENNKSSIYIIKYKNYFIFLKDLVYIDNIKSISHNLKRTKIEITYLDEKKLVDILKLKYNYKLWDFLNANK